MPTITISALEGNAQYLDGGAMFGNAPRVVWEKWARPDEQGRIRLACRCMLVEWGERKILCETGIGAYMEPTLAQRYGVEGTDHRLIRNLENLGVHPDQISHVILSHLHFDHAGGLLPAYHDRQEAKDELLFRNALYVVGAEAWERALHPHPRDRASFVPEIVEKLANSGRLQLVSGDSLEGLDPGVIRFLFSSGHTPGQMHTVVSGKNASFVFAGDLIPGKPWVHAPITMGYDRYPEKLIDEKLELYKSVLEGNWHIFFTHDPEIAAATIAQDTKGRYVTKSELAHMLRYSLND